MTAYRLRSLKFNYCPQTFSCTVATKLGDFNRLVIVDAKRLEIETRFLHPAEIKTLHGFIASHLRKKGITVYNNTPLLSGLNDSGEQIREIAYRCRENGIEFQQLYVAGLPVQMERAAENPVSISKVIELPPTSAATKRQRRPQANHPDSPGGGGFRTDLQDGHHG